jgi:acyl carrier protein
VGLARGYLNRPELTAEKFIPHPFSEQPGARLYKTGDLGRYLPDGNVEFIGRIDRQVKIRGCRIELGEIESVLGQHPAVREAVVLAWEAEPGDKRLVAYVVAADEGAPRSTELRSHLKERLPEYMVPATFVLLEAMPLTPNGKLDHKALPAPEGSRPELGVHHVPPRTPTEELLAEIWAQVLRVERVGIHDNFFELGGHSLLLLQLRSCLAQELQRDIPIVDLFRYPTIASLAAHQDGSARPAPSPALRRAERRVTAGQRYRAARGKGRE